MLCPCVPVLLYHRVGPERGTNRSTPEQFWSHMQYLVEHGYKTLTRREYEAYAMDDTLPVAKAVLITFDDGFANTFTHALPILKHFGMHALTFVITQEVGEGPPRRGSHAPPPEASAYLRWTEIEEMVASGVFEAHSHSHAHAQWHELYPDETERLRVLEADLLTSRRVLTERLGGTVLSHLAWPWGRSREDSRALARRLGFDFQYTVKYDFNTQATPLDQINRLHLDGKSLASFVAQLEFFRNSWISRIYPSMRGKYDRLKGLIAAH
jgi:peptidoglycan/xylan/chitin deacetylase (PgdA/CDA1 family)